MSYATKALLTIAAMVATVLAQPQTVTIPAGQTSAMFNIATTHNLSPGTKRHVTIMAGAVVFKYAALTVEY